MKKLLVLLFGLTAVTVLAQSTNSLPVIPGVPVDTAGWFTMAIVGITPLIIASLKWFVPKVPTVVLPFLAPAIGLALSQVEAWVTQNPSQLVAGAVAGGLGVWLREALDQVKQKLAAPVIVPEPPAS